MLDLDLEPELDLAMDIVHNLKFNFVVYGH